MPGLPRPPQKTVKIYHLPNTAAASQGYPSTPDITTVGGFLPLDRKEHVMEGGDLNVAYEVYLDIGVDVRTTDKIVIDGVNYYSKSVFTADVGRLRHKRVTLSTQE